MERFIEELKKKGIFDRIVRCCMIGNKVIGTTDIPVTSVENILCHEMVKDDNLAELFVECVSDLGYKIITDELQEAVQIEKSKKDCADEIIDLLMGLMNAINNQEDDLK